jgi:hypothetical protein
MEAECVPWLCGKPSSGEEIYLPFLDTEDYSSSSSGLPDGLFANQKPNLGTYILEGL